jgi:predicted glycogen debranching enzyme
MNNYFMETHHHEWILTNKLGAYALGTGNLINQRKYHGLLIASDEYMNRRHLVSGIEEKVEWRGELIHLDSNNYSNCIYPEGFLHLVKPWLRPYPAFLYSALPHQNEILILKEIMMDEDSNTTLVKYTNLGQHLLHFEFHPKFSMCSHHDLNPHGSMDFEEFENSIETAEGGSAFSALRKKSGLRVFGAVGQGKVSHNRYVYYNVYYPWEVMSGYAGIGDQISLFQIDFELAPGQSNFILFSNKAIDDVSELYDRILSRYDKLPQPIDFPKPGQSNILESLDYDDNYLFSREQYLKILEFALSDFVTGNDVIAGYPYYGAWGRDTMVVVNALLRKDENLELVERILRKYSAHIRDGLIPNMLAETGREANYDSLDATLWYVIMLWKYGKRKNRKGFWAEAIKLAENILQNMSDDSEKHYQLREDALLELKPEFAHGSWMDVRIEGKAVTPRWGAPVEINSLWYNALCAYEAMCEAHNSKGSKKHEPILRLLNLKHKVHQSFTKFEIEGFLADRLEGDKAISELRPNALIALSLPWSPVSLEKMKQVWECSFKELYTYYGLRTLSPSDSRFRKKYYGTQKERDLAYHNGSVWAWLLGPFCSLYLKLFRNKKSDVEIAKDLSEFIAVFRKGFMRGHIASIAEVWDGDMPHFPKGAPAQAWSVAALYNIETFLDSLGVKI